MDKHLNSEEAKLQALLHSKSYADLSESEKTFVLKHISSADYELERMVIENTDNLFADEGHPKARPLILPARYSAGHTIVQLRFYRVALGIAGILILLLLAFPALKNNYSKAQIETKYITQIDTVEKEVLKWDTVYQIVETPIYIEKKIYVDVPLHSNETKEAPRLLNTNSDMIIPEISNNTLSNKGTSLKDDDISSLITEF